MMKVLVIDPICHRGHINFDNIHIKALKNTECKIEYILKDSFSKILDLNQEDIKILLRENNLKNGLIYRLFINRLKSIKDYIKIRTFLYNHNYNAVIFLSYDEILIPIIGKHSNVYLINHNNLAGVANSYIKNKIFLSYAKYVTHIVFDNASGKYLASLGLDRYKIIPHGLVNSFSNRELPLEYSQYNYVIFSPSRGSIDNELCKNIIKNQEFLEFLKSKNILLIIRSDNFIGEGDNVIVLKGRLNNATYEGIYSKSALILAPYPSSFQYRTSGVVMEGIANNKHMLVSDIPAFRVYEDIIGADSYFSTNNFIERIKQKIIEIENQGIDKNYVGKELLNPNYNFLIEETGK